LHDRAALVEYGCVDPAVVEFEPGRPDHGRGLDPAAVLEGDRGARRGDRARAQLDAEPTGAARTGPDECLALAHAPADPRARRHPHEPARDQPVEHVAPEQPLRDRSLAGADREVHLFASR
jgi:hypothetical protein